jgi:ABC-type nitrate/sulfonate/bicarbonate transport system substrate-binding protein
MGARRASTRGITTLIAISIISGACASQTTDAAPPTAVGTSAESASEEAQKDLGEITVVTGIAQTFDLMQQQLGHDLGVWEKRGLRVIDLVVGGGGQVGQTMAAKEADIALTTGTSAIAPILGGLDAPIIAAVAPDFTLVACVRPDSEAQTPADLEGATIGITSPGSGTDFLADSLALAQGWEVGTDFHKASLGGLSEMVAALDRGVVEAFISTAELCFQMEERGEGRVLFSFAEIVTDNVFEIIAAQGEAIESRPEAVAAYLEGWFETTRWMQDNREATIQWVVDNWGLSETAVTNTYDLSINNLSIDGTVSQESLVGVAESLVALGTVDVAPEVEIFWDPRFVPVSVD